MRQYSKMACEINASDYAWAEEMERRDKLDVALDRMIDVEEKRANIRAGVFQANLRAKRLLHGSAFIRGLAQLDAATQYARRMVQ